MVFEGWFRHKHQEAIPAAEGSESCVDIINNDPTLLDEVKQIKMSLLSSGMSVDSQMVERVSENLGFDYDATVQYIDRLQVGEAEVMLPNA